MTPLTPTRRLRRRSLAAPALLAAAAFAAACGRGARPADDAAPAVAEDPACVHAPAEPRYDSPARLVDEYARRDGAGEFLRSRVWLGAAVECPGRLPDADALTLVSSYATHALGVDADTARVEVRYQVEGTLRPTAGRRVDFDRAFEQAADTIVAVRKHGAWYIVSPPTSHRLLPATAFARFEFKPEDRGAIGALMRVDEP